MWLDSNPPVFVEPNRPWGGLSSRLLGRVATVAEVNALGSLVHGLGLGMPRSWAVASAKLLAPRQRG